MDPKNHHVMCITGPAQGHINPMLKLATLLHSQGFYITFVHTVDTCAEQSKSNSETLDGLDRFRYESLLEVKPVTANGVVDLCRSLSGPVPKNAFRSLLGKLQNNNNSNVPRVSCVISDAHLNFTYDVGEELGVQVMLLYTSSACGALGFLHYDELLKRGIFPIQDESNLTNGFLDAPADWIPGLKDGAKLKHLPLFLRAIDTHTHEAISKYHIDANIQAIKSKSLIFNTFDDLEGQSLEGIKTKIPNLYTIGPLNLLCQQSKLQNLLESNNNLWKEDTSCLSWLDKRSPNSVMYVNYGSFTILTMDELEEFAWGLANSKQYFLLVIRDNLVSDESKILSDGYMEEIRDRGLITSWCPQQKVLKHPSVGGFLTHCGWNSISESISEGIPMICWPFIAEQPTNCFYACHDWGIGIEIGEGEVKRGRIEEVVREMMVGEKGKEMKEKAMEWKKKAQDAITFGGSSFNNFENLVKRIMGKENM